MVKEKIFLVQFQDAPDSDVTEIVADSENNGRLFKVRGLRIYSVHDHNSQLVAQYNAKDDYVDLSFLEGKEGYHFVTVAKDEYGNFFWYCAEIKKFGNNGDKMDIILIDPFRKCTDEESILLDEVYPEFRENAF